MLYFLYVLLFLAMIPAMAFLLSEAFIALGISLALTIHWLLHTPRTHLYPLLLALIILSLFILHRHDAHHQSHRLRSRALKRAKNSR